SSYCGRIREWKKRDSTFYLKSHSKSSRRNYRGYHSIAWKGFTGFIQAGNQQGQRRRSRHDFPRTDDFAESCFYYWEPSGGNVNQTAAVQKESSVQKSGGIIREGGYSSS